MGCTHSRNGLTEPYKDSIKASVDSAGAFFWSKILVCMLFSQADEWRAPTPVQEIPPSNQRTSTYPTDGKSNRQPGLVCMLTSI